MAADLSRAIAIYSAGRKPLEQKHLIVFAAGVARIPPEVLSVEDFLKLMSFDKKGKAVKYGFCVACREFGHHSPRE